MNNNPGPSDKNLLEALRKSIEAPAAVPAITEKQEHESISQGQPSRDLLDKLKAHVGNVTIEGKSEDFRENDYDISGFEIEEENEDELKEMSAETVIDRTIESAENQEDKPSEIDELPPWESQEINSLKIEENAFPLLHGELSEESKKGKNSDHMPSLNETTEQPLDVASHFNEKDKNAAQSAAEEAVRQKVELFVEQTVDPEESFDYFAELDRRTERNKQRVQAEIEANEKIDSHQVEENLKEASGIESKETEESHGAEMLTEPEFQCFSEPAPQANEEGEQSVSVGDFEFFYRAPKAKTAETNATGSVSKAGHLDDTDINLLLALGKKEALEESVGFVRVREAKNNFYDPADEDPIGQVFAYDGEEYRSPDQIESIKTAYRKERKVLYRRLIGTILLALLLLFIEHFNLLGVTIPYVSALLATDIYRLLLHLGAIVVCVLLSFRSIAHGAKGFVTMRPNQHTPLAVLSIIYLAYSLSILLFFRSAGYNTYGFALSVFWLLSIIGDNTRLSKEMLTFDVISAKGEKFSLEKAEASPDILREKAVHGKRDLLVERVSFVGKYFTRTSKRPDSYTRYFVELLICLSVSILVSLLAAHVFKTPATGLQAFVFSLFVCVPMQHIIQSCYPLNKLSKKLYRHECAIIGETVDREYVGANTVYLDDIEMFGPHGVSISGLRVYNDENIYRVLYLASAVFSQVEGPLRYVFENSSHEIESPKSVKLKSIYANGIEAMVDSVDKIYIGNVNFMRSNGFFPKRNEDDEKKVENGEFSILYISVNGMLCAKFYLKYTITEGFESFVSEMNANNTKVGIRTLDPSITERMISLLRKDKATEISVIRPTLNDLVPLGRRSDSGIITANNPHMISHILADCAQLKKINYFSSWARILSIAISTAAIISLLLIGWALKIPSLYIIIYQLLWLIPSLIYTNIKFSNTAKNRKKK